MIPRGLRLGSTLLAGCLLLASCGGAEPETLDEGVSTPPTSQAPDESATTEDDDGLTAPGTELTLGEPATISWMPKQDLEGSVEVSVDRLELRTMKDFSAFRVERAMRRANPYYVTVTVSNVGDTNLGGVEVPIFLDNGSDVLTPSARFTSSHKPCRSLPLPKKFAPGKETQLCLVFLAENRSELQSIIVRPQEEIAPITWTGKVREPKPEKKRKKN